jgi:hypothetical protein
MVRFAPESIRRAAAGRRGVDHRQKRLVAVLYACAALAAAGRADENTPIYDLLEVRVQDRQLLAIDAQSGGQLAARLELGERVIFTRQRGRVGIAVTDRRMLGAATISGFWQSERLRRREPAPADAVLGDRVALLLTPQRALGFVGRTGNFSEAGLGPRERVLDSAVGANVLVVVTERRALGLSADRGGFFEIPIFVDERIESLSAYANHVTLQTLQRLLVFRGPTGTWEEQPRTVRP